MTEVRRSLQELRTVAEGFKDSEFADVAEESLSKAGLATCWPTMASLSQGLHSGYEGLVEGAIHGARNLQGAIEAVGEALDAVATYYQEEEAENQSDVERIEAV